MIKPETAITTMDRTGEQGSGRKCAMITGPAIAMPVKRALGSCDGELVRRGPRRAPAARPGR
ncbi:hypothetical protein GCM10010279_17200 [Streptomyces mutabilis]|nr:hypothetical protein GCM10010279_17200 [Streptomyces mutabilis]